MRPFSFLTMNKYFSFRQTLYTFIGGYRDLPIAKFMTPDHSQAPDPVIKANQFYKEGNLILIPGRIYMEDYPGYI